MNRVPPKLQSNIKQRIARRLVAICLTSISLAISVGTVRAIQHPTFISWLPDQRALFFAGVLADVPGGVVGGGLPN